LRPMPAHFCHLIISAVSSVFGVFSTFLVRNMQTAAEFSKDHFTGFVRQIEFSQILSGK